VTGGVAKGMEMATYRICFIGDSITAGMGDVEMRGWPSRLCADETGRGHNLSLYNLGIGGDTSELVATRWRAECELRLPARVNGALVFAFGLPDLVDEIGVGTRVPMERSLAAARTILASASAWVPTLMIGPVPTVDDMQPYILPNGTRYHVRRANTEAQSVSYGELCADLDVAYLDLFTPFAGDDRWDANQRAIDGTHPNDAGYAMIAQRVAAWPAWRAWFDD
jgi:acyl-CoA thioesterase-1